MSFNPVSSPADSFPLDAERAGEWALLADVTAAFAQNPNIHDTLSVALNRVMDLMHAEAASIFLFNAAHTHLHCEACAGPESVCAELADIRLPVGTGIIGRAASASAPIMVRDVSHDPDFAAHVDQQTGFQSRSIIAAPLRVSGEELGAIEVVNKKTGSGLFNASDSAALSMLATAAALAIRNARITAELVEQERMRRELELAREIQRSLLPKPRPDFPVIGLNIPAREVSGDFFDFYELDQDRIAFNLADVSGKGLNAALMGVKASSLLRGLGRRGLRPGELLAVVNDELCETATRGMFVTVITGIYDRRDGQVCFANAGHPPPLLLRDGKASRLDNASAPPLGILPRQTFMETSCRLLESRLYLYSDGLSEALDESGEEVGIEGVMQGLQRSAGMPVADGLEQLARTAVTGSGDQDRVQRDDVTLLCVNG